VAVNGPAVVAATTIAAALVTEQELHAYCQTLASGRIVRCYKEQQWQELVTIKRGGRSWRLAGADSMELTREVSDQ
jgi:hypothetical protein